ncbi:MAG: thymidine phosphorylase [Fuerstiella sp.]
MIPSRIIAAKRDGDELTDSEIAFFVQGYSEDRIPDYQMSALAMAIYLNGMTERETAALTREMLASGSQLCWPEDGVFRVDKHSTGGVGDKVSLPLAPILACCGLQVPMLSGRGLGATGGTLDKLEAIPGYRTDLSLQEIQSLTQQVGCVITGASEELAPADRRLYALRDVTATVPSIPLITASIMSKKLAESLDALVLDVKFGSGAFMKTQQAAMELADSLVRTGRRMGVRTTAILTNMNQPLGQMCGNALEVLESRDVLTGGGPDDVRELTELLAAELLVSVRLADTTATARQQVQRVLNSGAAYEKFHQMVRAQGGSPDAQLKVAAANEVQAERDGFVTDIDTEQIGLQIISMGGGRQKVGDAIDHAVGVQMLVRTADRVERGQPLAKIFCNDPAPHLEPIRKAIRIGETASPLDLIVDRISSQDANGEELR